MKRIIDLLYSESFTEVLYNDKFYSDYDFYVLCYRGGLLNKKVNYEVDYINETPTLIIY